MSTGADTKSEHLGGLVREAGGLLQRAQRGVGLQALGESSSSLGTKSIVPETASVGEDAAAEKCQWALTRKQHFGCGGALEVGDLRLLEDGSERSDALVSNVVLSETASEGQDGIW